MVVSRRGMKLARGLGWVSRAGVAASAERDERAERASERASRRKRGERGEKSREQNGTDRSKRALVRARGVEGRTDEGERDTNSRRAGERGKERGRERGVRRKSALVARLTVQEVAPI